MDNERQCPDDYFRAGATAYHDTLGPVLIVDIHGELCSVGYFCEGSRVYRVETVPIRELSDIDA